MFRLLGLVGVAALLGMAGLASADNHHNAHALLGNRLKANGKHLLHTNGAHTAHAHVQGGKVARVEVIHKTNGPVMVTKYMTNKRLHADAGSGVEHHYVSNNGDGTEPVGVAGVAYIGWGYTVNGVVVIYWFPVAVVLGGPQGAIFYQP